MREARREVVGRGLRRRGRLLAEALRPPAGIAPPRPAVTAARPAPRTADPATPRISAPATEAEIREGARVPGAYAVPLAPRLVESPVFVLSPVRSGSTLLRVVLNSHPRIRAPHEMHLRTLHVRMDRDFTPEAMRALQLDKDELEHLLWDRVLHMELTRSGKDVIVDKTPPNTLIWPRLRRAWPRARYLFLVRHPGAIVSSLTNRRDKPDPGLIHAEVLDYAERLEEARRALPGHTLTYEELTAEPERVTREICAHLDLEWEAGMLDYGAQDHGAFRPQLGDWSDTIKSGRIQPARLDTGPGDLPARLREIAESWGYAPAR